MQSSVEELRNDQGRMRFARLAWSIASAVAFLVACAVQGPMAPQQYRSEALAATGWAPALGPSAARVVEARGRAGAAGGSELPLCDLAEVPLPAAPESCVAPSVDAAPDGASSEGAPPGVASSEGAIPEDISLEAAASNDAASNDAASKAAAPENVSRKDAVSDDARAASKESASSSAPMCDPSAASIAAAVQIPEVDRGRLEALPCDGERLLSLLRSHAGDGEGQPLASDGMPRPSPRAPLVLPGHEGIGALALLLEWPRRQGPSMLARPLERGLTGQAGHRSRLFRPPWASSRASAPRV